MIKILFSTFATCIILTVYIHKSKQDIVKLKTDFSQWNASSSCAYPFQYNNSSWSLNSCGKKIGADFCKLTSRLHATNRVNELTLLFRVNMSRTSKSLYLFIKRQINQNDYSRSYLHRIDKTYISGRQEYEAKSIKWRIEAENYQGITMEFRDHEGFCGTIDNLEILYYTCDREQDDLHLVQYNQHSAPAWKQQEMSIPGSCKENSIQDNSTTIYKTCDWLGKSTQHGECYCKQGYTKTTSECVPCKDNRFKTEIGNHACQACGTNSTSTRDGTTCSCVNGFFREFLHQRNFSAPCYDGRPKEISFSSMTPHSINISWSYVQKRLESGNTTFVVACKNCKNEVSRAAFAKTTTSNFVNVDNLHPNTHYVFAITVKFSNKNYNELIVYDSFHTLKYYVITTSRPADQKATLLTLTIVVCSGLLIILMVVLVTLYVKQKQKTSHFLTRINSLKKSRRPPPPPVAPTPTTFDIRLDDEDGIDNDDINPYAVFILPKIAPLETDEESVESENDYNERKHYSNRLFQLQSNENTIKEDTDGYVCMSAHLKNMKAQRASNHYTSPKSLHVDRFKRCETRMLPCPPIQKVRTQSCLYRDASSYENKHSLDPQIKLYPGGRIRTQSCLIKDTPNVDLNICDARKDVQWRLDRPQADDRRERTKSCLFKDSVGFELTFQQIEKAKLTNRYRSKECLSGGYITVRRPHSADDVNKLHDL